jgi:hypothetical protein
MPSSKRATDFALRRIFSIAAVAAVACLGDQPLLPNRGERSARPTTFMASGAYCFNTTSPRRRYRVPSFRFGVSAFFLPALDRENYPR